MSTWSLLNFVFLWQKCKLIIKNLTFELLLNKSPLTFDLWSQIVMNISNTANSQDSKMILQFICVTKGVPYQFADVQQYEINSIYCMESWLFSLYYMFKELFVTEPCIVLRVRLQDSFVCPYQFRVLSFLSWNSWMFSDLYTKKVLLWEYTNSSTNILFFPFCKIIKHLFF